MGKQSRLRYAPRMNVDKIRAFSHAEPFHPFTICLSAGQRLAIEHPEFVAISPTRDTLQVSKPDGNFFIVQTDQITGLQSPKRRPKAKPNLMQVENKTASGQC